MATAAQLFNHHVFLDLETTGLDPARDEVIEVGALFIDRGRPVRRISRLFRPSRPLEPVIRELTGLTDKALHHAPSFGSFIPDLTHALLGWTVVAHNASFEQGFLHDLLGQIEAPVLDSCELLHYLHPELTSHSLDSMIRWAGLGGGVQHRALADCEDTYAVLCVALERCIQEKRQGDVRDLLECLGASGDWSGTRGDCPLVALLSGLLALCERQDRLNASLREGLRRSAEVVFGPQLLDEARSRPWEAVRIDDQMSRQERAPRAYLRALLRREPEPDLQRISAWFKSHFPALEKLVDSNEVHLLTALPQTARGRLGDSIS